MRVLLLGGGGQLGRELVDTAPVGVELIAPGRDQADLTEAASLERALGEVAPDVVINAAAYTAVDRAEEEREAAFAVNAQGPRFLATCLRPLPATRLIHVSTDFVFDGTKSSPYLPEDETSPLGVYGTSKLAGEQAVRELIPDRSLIVRTSWLYSSHRANFVLTMLRLIGERDEVRVVSDQIGSPTWARGLALALWDWTARPEAVGVRHWADAGEASWYDLAMATGEEALELGLIAEPARVLPISTAEYPTAATRPPMSVLDTSQSLEELRLEPRPWRDSLREMLMQYRDLADV